MLLAAFSAVIAWATGVPATVAAPAPEPVAVESRVGSPAHPGRGAPEAGAGWGAAQLWDSLPEGGELAGSDARPRPESTVGHGYDVHGRVLRTEWPSGAVVTNAYGAGGELVTQTLSGPGVPPAQVAYTFDGVFGVPSGWTLSTPGGVWTAEARRERGSVWTPGTPGIAGLERSERAGAGGERAANRTSASKRLMWGATRSSSARVDTRRWTGPGGFDETLGLAWMDSGRLLLKSLSEQIRIGYAYDGLGRIERVIDVDAGGVDFERYARDVAGNPQFMDQRVGSGQTLWPWVYDATTAYGEIPGRTASSVPGVGTVREDFGYDLQGRLETWVTEYPGAANDTEVAFSYDGAGRVRRVERTKANAITERYAYDVDDGIPYEVRGTVHVFRHAGWEARATSETTYEVTESVLPMATLRDGTSLVMVLRELDGHALFTKGAPGGDTRELLGAFGLRLSRWQTTPDHWVLDGFQGEEVHRQAGVTHFGARHLALRDGAWLQPEPLLYLGLTNGNLKNPVGYSGVYAAGDSNQLQDHSGHAPFLLTLGASLAGHDVTQDPVAAATDPGTYVGAAIAAVPALAVQSCEDPNLVPALAVTLATMAEMGDAALGLLSPMTGVRATAAAARGAGVIDDIVTGSGGSIKSGIERVNAAKLGQADAVTAITKVTEASGRNIGGVVDVGGGKVITSVRAGPGQPVVHVAADGTTTFAHADLAFSADDAGNLVTTVTNLKLPE
jgi:hypothetical protein